MEARLERNTRQLETMAQTMQVQNEELSKQARSAARSACWWSRAC